jgi:regulator of RNase E activity RraA
MSETFSSATVYEAAQSVLVDPEIAVDPRIGPAWVGAALAGPAFTVQGAHGDNLALHRAVATAPAGHVLVVDVGGAAFGHWGEVLAVAARHRGIAGVVIDGGCAIPVNCKPSVSRFFPVTTRFEERANTSRASSVLPSASVE